MTAGDPIVVRYDDSNWFEQILRVNDDGTIEVNIHTPFSNPDGSTEWRLAYGVSSVVLAVTDDDKKTNGRFWLR